MKKTFIILLLLAFIFPFAQEIGMFFMQNYAPKEYQADSQNWSIVQDQRGIMYFANDKGVLEYDGKNWHLIPIKNESAVHSLSIDSSGVIYVGASGEFGYLEPDSIGEMHYHSLVDKLPKKDRDFADVWTTIATNEAVFFQTDNFLLRLNNKGTKVWYPAAQSFFFLAFYANETVFVHDFAVGLKTLKNKELLLSKAGKSLAGERIYTLLGFDKEKLLLGTRAKGLLQFNPKEDTVLTKFENEAEDFLLENRLYNGNKLNKNLFAFATRKGVVVLDKKGNIKNKFDKKSGLRDENIRAVYPNKERTLWLGLDNGLARIETTSPIRFWGEENGISGAIQDIIKFENTIYIATSYGIFYLHNNRFELVENSPITQCWDFEENYGGFLLVGTNEGIFKIKNKVATELQKTNSAVRKLVNFRVSPKNIPYEFVWVGQKQGLGALTFRQGQWHFQDSIANISSEIHSIYEYEPNKLWLGTFFDGVLHLDNNKNKVDKFGIKNGLPNLRDIHIHNVENQLAFTTSKGLYRFDGKNKFTRDSLGMSFWADTTKGIFDLKKEENGNVWFADFDTKDNPIGVAQKQGQNKYTWENTALQRLPQITKPALYIDEEGIVWLGGNQGLFRYDPKIPKKYKQNFYTILREVKAGNDLILLNGNQFANLENHFLGIKRVAKPQILNEKQVLDFSNSSVIFDFVAPYFEEESEIEYSTFLEGYDKHWNSWTKESKKEYGNLWEGTYTFRAKARNTFGIESQELLYHFEILPPWYRSIWAKILYVILAGLMIWGIARLYSYRLKQKNRILEEAVQLRTVELEQQKEEVLVQAEHLQQANEEISAINDELNTKNKEVEEKRKEITDSISYASRIQGAMLPTMDSIIGGLPESFVLYKPRDIVSGDFYWFAQTEPEPVFGLQMTPDGRQSIFKGFTSAKQIISAVDCTGHGVPGAFMSMIGETYLKQIISSESIISPERILNELHKKIRAALRQEEGDNRDGMDMTICVIDRDKKIIEFAGARNPVVYVQNNEMKVVNGDIFPIGGASYEKNEQRLFSKKEIPLENDTVFYLFSDGYQDQFGGPNGKKFMKRKFHELLYLNHHLPIVEQKEVLDKTLMDWMKEEEQVDDILVIGVKVSI